MKQRHKAAILSQKLRIPLTSPLTTDYDFLLVFTSERLELRQTGKQAPGPVYVDFTKGPVNYRRRRGGGMKQTIARAVGVKGGSDLLVLDATAGLGRDAFVLACLGCRVYLFERSPVIAALLADGLSRAREDKEIGVIVRERMKLFTRDSSQATAVLPADKKPDIVYLDPMYPHRNKNTLVKKEMRILRAVVGDDRDAPELLKNSLTIARKRVVVKRPRTAPSISGPEPSFAITSKNSRYDIYLV